MNIIIGPPGTGKTTTLLGIIEDALAKGIRPDRIGLVSFTRAAVGEAIERASKRFGLDPKEFRYFRTLHSLGHELSGRDRKLVTPAQVEAWGRDAGYQSQAGGELEGWAESGDGLQAVFEFARARRIDTRRAAACWRQGEIDWQRVFTWGKKYTEWKRANGLMDYTDMLEDALGVEPPALDLVAIDEAQDLSPLQQEFAARLLSAAREAYVVGDDDQAIHAWAGADAGYLQRLAEMHGYRVLSQSYRVPRSAHRTAGVVIGRVSRRVAKRYEPRAEVGQTRGAHWDRRLGTQLLQAIPEGAALLCRTKRKLWDAARWCVEQGIPYRSERGGADPLGVDKQLRGAQAIRRAQDAVRLTGDDWRALAAVTRAGHVEGLGRGVLASLKRIEGEPTDSELAELGAGPILERVRREGMQAADLIEPDYRSYYSRVLGPGGAVPPTLTLTTCHASKGREWHHVFLSPALTRFQRAEIDNASGEGDDEHRVAYVAATRCKSTLTIIEPEGRQPSYDYPIFRRVA